MDNTTVISATNALPGPTNAVIVHGLTIGGNATRGKSSISLVFSNLNLCVDDSGWQTETGGGVLSIECFMLDGIDDHGEAKNSPASSMIH